MPFFQGTLSKITDYKQLVFQVDEKAYQLAESWNCKRWENDYGKMYLQVNLDRYDKNAISRFEKLLKLKLNVSAVNKQFINEEDGKCIKYMQLKQLSKCKEQPCVQEEKTDIEKQFDAIEDEETEQTEDAPVETDNQDTVQPPAPRRRKPLA